MANIKIESRYECLQHQFYAGQNRCLMAFEIIVRFLYLILNYFFYFAFKLKFNKAGFCDSENDEVLGFLVIAYFLFCRPRCIYICVF